VGKALDGGGRGRPVGAVPATGRLQSTKELACGTYVFNLSHPDCAETEQTGVLLQTLAEKHAVIVIEHDMEFVRQIARTVTVLHEGTVICEGTVDVVQANDRVREIYLGRQKVGNG